MTESAADVSVTYEVLAKLGEGGMGSVFKVRHRLLDQPRVIKIMRAEVGADEGFRRRFLAEARLVADLHHHQLAELYEFAVAPSGNAYMVLEYIDGFTLKQLLGTGPPSIGLALEIGRQALEALAYLHGRGLVHRDISPDNLMLCRGSRDRVLVKLIDLGIARRSESRAHTQLTAPGGFIGKVSYAAPEQFGMDPNQALDARSDLYSFGIVLYELLTNHFPIVGESVSQILGAHLFSEPLAFSASDPANRIPEDLRAAVLRSLRKRPEDRYSGAEEFAETLTLIQQRFPWKTVEVDAIFNVLRRPPGDPATEAFRSADAERELRMATSRPERLEPPTLPSPPVLPIGAPAEPVAAPVRRRSSVSRAAALAVGAALLVFAAWLVLRSPSPAAEDAALAMSLNFGKYQAVVIGNNVYEHLEHLQTAVPDAEALKGLLRDQYGFEVELLQNVNRHDLLATLERRAGGMKPEDHLLVYYAGHGRFEEQNDRAYWQPVDAEALNTSNWVSSSEVSSLLFDAKARHVLVVADSCYSGAMATALPEDAGPTGSAADRRSWFESRLGKRGRLVLTSGGLDPVPDGGSVGHSIFARRLLDVLRENRGILRGRELYDLVTRSLEGQGRPGLVAKPSFGALKTAGDEGGEFFFVPKALRRVTS